MAEKNKERSDFYYDRVHNEIVAVHSPDWTKESKSYDCEIIRYSPDTLRPVRHAETAYLNMADKDGKIRLMTFLQSRHLQFLGSFPNERHDVPDIGRVADKYNMEQMVSDPDKVRKRYNYLYDCYTSAIRKYPKGDVHRTVLSHRIRSMHKAYPSITSPINEERKRNTIQYNTKARQARMFFERYAENTFAAIHDTAFRTIQDTVRKDPAAVARFIQTNKALLKGDKEALDKADRLIKDMNELSTQSRYDRMNSNLDLSAFDVVDRICEKSTEKMIRLYDHNPQKAINKMDELNQKMFSGVSYPFTRTSGLDYITAAVSHFRAQMLADRVKKMNKDIVNGVVITDYAAKIKADRAIEGQQRVRENLTEKTH